MTLGPDLTLWGEEIPREERLFAQDGAVARSSLTVGPKELADPRPSTVDIVLAALWNGGDEPRAMPLVKKLPRRPEALREEEEPRVPALCEASRTSGSATADEVVPIGMYELALEGWVSSGPDLSVLAEVPETS